MLTGASGARSKNLLCIILEAIETCLLALDQRIIDDALGIDRTEAAIQIARGALNIFFVFEAFVLCKQFSELVSHFLGCDREHRFVILIAF